MTSYCIIRFTSFIVSLACAASGAVAQVSSGNWRLNWSDEFNYEGLPDKSKWSYEQGFVRNNEQQYYTAKRKENSWVSNGQLTITAQKETFRNEKFKSQSSTWQTRDSLASYTSAAIVTAKKVSFK
jgi:hypothetical protein